MDNLKLTAALLLCLICNVAIASDLSQMCQHEAPEHDPYCKNGGRLQAQDQKYDYASCSHCNCTGGWTGPDCSLCTSIETCPVRHLPNGVSVPPKECTSDTLRPHSGEATKRFGCFCGGLSSDTFSSWICNKAQPWTHWMIELRAGIGENSSLADGTPFGAHIYERAGTPANTFEPREKWRYAYPGVFEGNLSDCTWAEGQKCRSPLVGEDCFEMRCGGIAIDCPPPGQETCPGFTGTACDKMPPPNDGKPYWVHKCSPLALPSPDKVTVLSCRPEADGGRFQCYFVQEGAFVGAIGMQCEVGDCLYAAPPPPPAPAPEPPHWRLPRLNHPEEVTLVCLGLLVAAFLAGVGYFVRLDRARVVHLGSHGSCAAQLHGGEAGSDSDDDQELASIPLTAAQRSHSIGEALMATAGRPASGSAPRRAAAFTFEGIHYRLLSSTGLQRHVLQGISGINAAPSAQRRLLGAAAPPRGEGLAAVEDTAMMSIMGPSGAGKSSLLDIISGRRFGEGVEGRLRVDGVEMEAQHVRAMAGYVHQDDVLPGTATVREYMIFHDSLRGAHRETPVLPGSSGRSSDRRRRTAAAAEAQQWHRITALLHDLGLLKSQDTLIGDAFTRGISGGEKRRLSVAVELLAAPQLLFLDEPTTGLDSTSSAQLVDILASLSAAGVNIIFSIHQPRPDILRHIDTLLLLSPVGQLVYCGPLPPLSAHLAALGCHQPPGTLNIADFLLDVVISAPSQRLSELVDGFARSEVRRQELGVAGAIAAAAAAQPQAAALPPLPPLALQLRVLSATLFRRTYRHPFLVATCYVATLAAAVGLGIAFVKTGFDTQGIQNRFGLLFFILLFQSLMALSSLPVWQEDMLLFVRERDARAYTTPAYFAARVLFDLVPLRLVPPLAFTLITYPTAGLHAGSAATVLSFTLTLVAANAVASLLCMCLGAALPTLTLANMVGTVVIMLSLLLCGFMLNGSALPPAAGALHWLSYFAQAYEMLVTTEFHNNPAPFFFTAPVDTLPMLRVTGDGVLAQFGYRPQRFAANLAALCMLGVLCGAITYVALLMTHPVARAQVAQALRRSGLLNVRQRAVGLMRLAVPARFRVEGASVHGARSPEASATQPLLSASFFEEPQHTPGPSTGGGNHRRSTSEAMTRNRPSAGAHRRSASEVMPRPATSLAPRPHHSRRASTTLQLEPMRPSVAPDADRTDEALPEEEASAGDVPEQPAAVASEAAQSEDTVAFQTAATTPAALSADGASVAEGSVAGSAAARHGRTASAAGTESGTDGARVTRMGSALSVLTSEASEGNGAAPAPLSPLRHSSHGAAVARTPLSWHGLSISVRTPQGNVKEIVRHVSGSTADAPGAVAEASSMLAILGPSGAGKSTLLDVLAGRVAGRAVHGAIAIAGCPTTPAQRQRLCGYVLQDDIFPGTSTVTEYLRFHAQLRMPAGSSAAAREARVQALLADFGLLRCAHSRIGDSMLRGLSGGEKRRLSIATELLTAPRLLLADEPTTGLDSTSAKRVVGILAALSASGVTIALSIHQPRLDIFEMLTHLLLLSGDGRMVFSGPARLAATHFTALGHPPPPAVNTADFILDIVIRLPPDQVQGMAAKFGSSAAAQALAQQSTSMSFSAALGTLPASPAAASRSALRGLSKHSAPLPLQIELLALRKLHSLLRHPWLLGFALVATLATAALMAVVYADMDRMTPGIQNRLAAFFFVALYLSLVSLSSVPVWQEERALFLRERAAGAYSTAAYLVTTIAYDLLFMRVLPPVLLTALAYPAMGLRAGLGHRGVFCGALMLCNVAAAAMNMAIGAACSSTSNANMLGSLAVLGNLLFGGFLMSLHAAPAAVRALGRLSIAYYAYNILAVNEFKAAEDYKLTPFRPPGTDPADLPHKDVDGNFILNLFYFRLDTMHADVLGLVLLSVGYIALTSLILHIKR